MPTAKKTRAEAPTTKPATSASIAPLAKTARLPRSPPKREIGA